MTGKQDDPVSFADAAPAVRRVLLYILFLNWAVSGAKIAYGYATDSIAMVSDGFHSLIDGMSNVFGLIGIWLASHPPDREHPYGHRKYETLFTIIIALMIFATSFQILKRAYESFTDDHRTVVNAGSFGVMAFTMLVNIFVMKYETKRGKELGSDFLIADAMHTRSDIMTSSSVILGLVFTGFGYEHADAIVGLVIAGFIVRIGIRIMKRASDILVDTVRVDADAVCNVVSRIEGVRGCHDVRSRGMGQHISLDLHVLVDPYITIKHAHEIADLVEERIKEAFPDVADIVVHTEPEES